MYLAIDPESTATGPERKASKPIGSGECAEYVQAASGAPHHKHWRKGISVRGHSIPRGAAIATFDADGTYGSRRDHTTHAAIYIREVKDVGIYVWDQWKGHAPRERLIHFQQHRTQAVDAKGNAILKNGKPVPIWPVNDADNYYIIEYRP